MKQVITITSKIVGQKENIWDMYTEPKHIVNWNFANEDWQCPTAENELVVGGEYKARMEAKDGSFGFDFEAVYTEVNAYENFIYRIEDGRSVKVEFKENEKDTDVIVSFEPEEQNSIELQQNGWQSILDNFKKYVENQ